MAELSNAEEAWVVAENELRAAKQELADLKQEVSDAMTYIKSLYPTLPIDCERFIIPKPKPDPLVDVAKMMGYFNTTANHWAEDVRAALDALGFEIREKGQ